MVHWTPLIIHMTGVCCFTASTFFKSKKEVFQKKISPKLIKVSEGENLLRIEATNYITIKSNSHRERVSKMSYYAEIYFTNKIKMHKINILMSQLLGLS